jgi:hypothetical protein
VGEKAALAAAAAAAKVRVVLASGQCLTADAVVACSAIAQGSSLAAWFSSNSSSTQAQPAASAVSGAAATPQLQQQHVACAVVLLDRSVVDGESSLLLVFPPGSLVSEQTAVIRGLQLGPAFGVAPPGKFLMYLSAVLPSTRRADISSSSSSSALAEQVLSPALKALAAGRGLQPFQFGDVEQQEGVQQEQRAAESNDEPAGGAAAAGGVSSVSKDAGSKQQPQKDMEQQQQQQLAESLLPQVLAVCYFTRPQPMQQFCSQAAPAAARQDSSSSSCHPGAVVWCPAAAQGFMGYTQVVREAEAAYRQQFPGLPWLTDAAPSAQPAAAAAAGGSSGEAADGASAAAASDQAGDGVGGAGGAAGGGVLDDGELDAIDELTAALLELSAPPKEQSSQQPPCIANDYACSLE